MSFHKPRITRKELGPFLRENGFPVGDSTIDKECAPSVGKGPPVAAWWGRRPLYDPSEALAWAAARLRPTRQDRVPGSISDGNNDTASGGIDAG